MKLRLLSLSLVVAMLLAALTPTAHADSLPASAYAPAEARGDDPPGMRWAYAPRLARQVSGLPWSRVWVERNLFRNRGR